MSKTSSDSTQVVRVMNRGWLWKHGGRVRNWKKRFFVLTTVGRLTYYSQESDAEAGTGALGIIDVQKALYVTRRVKGEEPGAWPDAVPENVCFTIITNDRNYGVYAEDEKDADKWVQMLQTVRGGVDKSDILVEQVAEQPPVQRRASMSSHMANFCTRFKLMELSPKVQMMWMKWNGVGQRALKAMADHFGIAEEITLVCDAGDMYKRLPTNKRTRIGEYIFADYMDELQYNLCQEFGDEDIAKAAFRAAFSKRKIKVQLKKGDSLAPNTTEISDGTLVLTIYETGFGNGIHLAGKGLVSTVEIKEDETISDGSVTGMTVDTVANILRELPALQKATVDLQAKLPGNPGIKFKCGYKKVQAGLNELDSSFTGQLGTAIIQSIVIRLVNEMTAFIARAGAETAERIAGESSDLEIVFELADPSESSEPAVSLNSEGQIVAKSTAKKLLEMQAYDRLPNFKLEDVFV